MNNAFKINFPLFAALSVTLASCVTDNPQKSSLAAQAKTAEQAFENGGIDKAQLLKVLLETDLERGRLAYEQTRFMMARSPTAERLYDPPRHYRHREMLKTAKEAKEINEQEYLELSDLSDKAHDAWLARRRKVTRDRAIWGFPR